MKYPVDQHESLIRESLARGYSARQVAAAVGCSDHYVRRVRDGIPRGKPGPKPAPVFARKVQDAARRHESSGLSEDSMRVQRAVRHWMKNDDLGLSEVAEMYDIDDSSLLRAMKRARGDS